MPQTITHACFGKDLYNKLSDSEKEKISYREKDLMMFSQSTDCLMFYNIYTPFLGKEYRNLHYTFHSKKINFFFSTLINYMKKKEYYNDPKTLVFLYGLISHFCLDSTAHPYIIYRAGMFDKSNKKTYKYNGLHAYMESYIDNYYLANANINNFKFKDFCFSKEKFTKELNESITYSFNKVYKLDNIDKVYYKSLKQMNSFLTLFRCDKYGIKKVFYELIDLVTPKYIFRFKSLSYHTDDYSNNDLLNLNKNIWNYPVDISMKYNKSFLELYDEALNNAYYIITEINKYFFLDKKIDINDLFKNKSYVTGIDCNKKAKSKYFEF